MLIQGTEIISIHAGIRAGKKYRFPQYFALSDMYVHLG